jgi:O-antigen ligase/polysaccharide polymerase Wzy-like membrane protein
MPRADVGAAGLPAAAAGLLLFALLFGHGTSDSRLFWIGVAALLVASVAVVWRPRPVAGTAAAFLAFVGALVLWQAATIAWSIEPAASWDYANRGLVYFAFACVGVLLGSVPRSWVAAGLGALLTAVLLVALLAKVVPALYADYGRLARLRWPLEYWNELALVAAMTVPLGLWLASRRERPLRARVAGALHVYVALVAVVLTFSRFGIALAVLAAAAWVWLDRERLDSLAALVAVVPPAAVVAAVAVALPGIADDGVTHSTRVRDGALFAVLFALGAVVAGAVARTALAREPDVARRRRAALGAGAGLAAVCVVAVIVLIVRAGGPLEFVRVRWHEFSATQSVNTVAHFGSASSGNRWAWWQQSWDAFTRHPGGGTGAGSFALTSTIAAHNSLQTTIEPHNTPLQFLTETGIVGFLLYVGVIATVVVGVLRGPRDRATYALVFVAVIGLLHSIVDIDWSFVATQAPLFLLSGVLASRPAEPERRRVLVLAGTGVAVLAALYSLFLPWYANRRFNDGLDAAGRGDIPAAQAALSDAHKLNPLAIEPIQFLAAVDEPLGEVQNAESLYALATKREPLNPDTWYALGSFYARHGRWREAYAALNRSYSLNNYAPTQLLALLDLSRCQIDPVTCSASQLAKVRIPPSRLVTLARLAKRAAVANGERHPRGIVYVTTRGRFPLTAADATRPANRTVYAIVLRGHFVVRGAPGPSGAASPRGRFLELAVDPRTFEVTDFGVELRAPSVARLGRPTLLPSD